ncbi:MAG: PAS domain-containing protein [Kordiimonadaceae bacterium]|jgi:hypothetical protein|nr:PAS domain-containing protein [Kordiimonadaceae bacterium]
MQKLKLSQISTNTKVYKFSNYFDGLKRTSCSLIPDWSSFDPMEIAELLPWIAVIERNNESPSGHHYRLIGESVIRLMGKNYTGKKLDEVLAGNQSNDHWKDLQTVVECRTPSFAQSVIPVENRDFNKIIRGCFPFCDNTKNIIRLIIVLEVI